MKNYFDKYIKYKSKYLKIKNQQFGGEPYDCSDKKITEVICEQNPDGQWDNKEECEKSKICIENNRLINNHEVIMLIRKNKKLLEKYNIYKENIDIPELNNLRDNLDKIKFVEENKHLLKNYEESNVFLEKKTLADFFSHIKMIKIMDDNKNLFIKYNIYKEGSTIPLLSKLMYSLDKIKSIEANKKLLKKYNAYNEDNLDVNYLTNKLKVIASIEANPKSIELIEQNPNLKEYIGYRENDIVKSVEKVQLDIDNIKQFHNNNDNECKSFEIPKTFYISGLLTFAVYKNEKLNKIIYLLGEKHNFKNVCDIKETNGIKHYNADEFFFSLLQESICGKNNDKYNNKLDVFLEMKYNPLSNYFNEKFSSIDSMKLNLSSYLRNTEALIYNKHCYPQYLKNNDQEHKICMYDPYVRFHHADLRKINDEFIKYITRIYLLYSQTKGDNDDYTKFIDNYEKYSDDTKYVLNIYTASNFIKKINKQVDNIVNKNIKLFFEAQIIKLNDLIYTSVKSGDLSYKRVLQIFNNDILIKKNDIIIKKINILTIFNTIMDLYLLSRIFRTFDINKELPYDSTNIIIYSGNHHIETYIDWLKKLGFKKLYDFNSTITEKRACIKVDNFNMEYY